MTRGAGNGRGAVALAIAGLAMALVLSGQARAQSAADETASSPPSSDQAPSASAASQTGSAPTSASSGAAFTCANPPIALNGIAALQAATPGGFAVPTAQVSPRRGALEFTYWQPAAAVGGDLRLSAYLLTPGRGGGATALRLEPISVAHPINADALPDVAKAAGADGQSAYLVRMRAPGNHSWALEQRETLIVLACGAPSGGAQTAAPVGYAQVQVQISNGLVAGLLAFVVMALVYLLAGLIRWQASVVANAQVATLAKRVASHVHGRVPARLSRRGAQYHFADYFNPVVMSADIFNRASLSQLQIFGFLLLVGYGVTYSLLRTGSLSELSDSIVYLLGIPAVGALGSHVATTSKDRFTTDNWSWLVSHHVLTIDDPGTDKPRWRDVLMTGSEIDLYKLQAFTFSLIVALALIYSGFTSLQTFTVPDTLLQIMGLSQVVFVGGHFTNPANIADADKLVTELRKRASDLRVAVATGIDVDSNGAPLNNGVGAQPPNAVSNIAGARLIAANATARYLETANELEVLLKGLTYRDVVTDALQDPFKWDAGPPAPPTKVPPGPPPAAP